MAQDVDRNKVLQTIRVRSAIKKDGSWIQGQNDAKKEQDTAGTSHAVETKPSPFRGSHVRSTAKRFEAIDSSPSSPLQKAEVVPSEGDSTNQASGEIIPALKDTQPKGSAAETKRQAPTKEPIQSFKAQPEKAFTDATAENTEQHADAPADTCHNEAEASADADVKNPAVKIAAVEGTVRESGESKCAAGVPGECLIKREPANATNLEHAGVNLHKPPAVATSGKEASLQGSGETPAVSDATPKEKAALQNSVISVPDTLPKPSAQPDADDVKSVESKVKSAKPSEAVFKTGTDELVECIADNTVVKKSFASTPKTAADHVKELNTDDALEHVAASDAEGVKDNTVYTAIRLTDALDVQTPTTKTVPKPVEEPKQPHSEESKLKQKCDDSYIAEVFQKPAADIKSTQTLNKSSGKSVCYFCNQIFNGTVKIIFSEPPMSCHPECLKCGVCARALGDMLTPMFLKDQVIQCRGCFSQAVKK